VGVLSGDEVLGVIQQFHPPLPVTSSNCSSTKLKTGLVASCVFWEERVS
jgi:hypothetical protein